ncbi:DUF1499 domain-containing protein [Ferviditalea candida]|uniref:DUF1499 domain-containing protein n=1 Tax=Ferviditalea candida TaxID=3108399 RepID=A0ABU5ZCK2_9BACL|nr:DUF1499 domain-containing protein [Paenibacillaceae bacterium T2]
MYRTLVGLVRSFEQTSENAADPLLRTKYYRLSRDRMWADVVELLKQMKGYERLHEAKSLGEIVVEKKTPFGRKQDITLTLYAVSPLKTAVDIYSASRGSLGDFGSNYRTISEIYSGLDRKFAGYKEN